MSTPAHEPPVGLAAEGADIGGRGRLARAVAEAVGAVPGVRLTGGTGTEVATQHRGGKIPGVGLRPEAVTVQVVASVVPLGPVARAVHVAARRALDAADDRRPVRVVIADLDAADLRTSDLRTSDLGGAAAPGGVR